MQGNGEGGVKVVQDPIHSELDIVTYIVFLSSQLELLGGILSSRLICQGDKANTQSDRRDKRNLDADGEL